MQIVIEIDEREWMDEKSIREVAFEYKKGSGFDRAIREGLRQAIVLPKGHGRLIDADKLVRPEIRPFLYHLKNGDTAIPEIDILHAPTIIEADKEEKKNERFIYTWDNGRNV